MAVLEALNQAYDRYYAESGQRVLMKDSRQDSRHHVGAGAPQGIGAPPQVGLLARHYELQQALRPLFGKGDAVEPSIGDHPDFVHLKGTRTTEFAPITTLFMDMEGSTRLGLLYEPREVFKIKNAVIQSTIDIIKAFDGHVHRIMGDAVMAYFGGKALPVEQGAIDALNCAATLRALIGTLVDGRLQQMAGEEQLGIRIGVDFGPKEKVLWGAYGYPGMDEVTATSFYVDVASKLQHDAGRNQIILGQSLRDLLDVPEVLLDRKSVTKNGERQEEPYLSPNYTNAEGKPVNYRKYLLRWDDYLGSTNLAATLPEVFAKNGATVPVSIGVGGARDDGAIAGSYSPCAGMVQKGRELRFEVTIPAHLRLPLDIDFRVENHGKEASQAENWGNHSTPKRNLGDVQCVHWESTKYRGLHYLDVLIKSGGTQVLKRRLGIWVA